MKKNLFVAMFVVAAMLFVVSTSFAANEQRLSDSNREIDLMIRCIRSNSIKDLEYILDKGVNINLVGTNGETPLYVAVTGRKTGIVELLLKKGADVDIKTKDGNTVLIRAVDTYHNSSKNSNEEKDILSILNLILQRTVNIDAKNQDGDTALLKSVNEFVGPSLDVTRLLVEKGADIHAKNKYGTVLMTATEGHPNNSKESKEKRAEVIKFLLEKGATSDINIIVQDHLLSKDFGHTALSIACVREKLGSYEGSFRRWSRPQHTRSTRFNYPYVG